MRPVLPALLSGAGVAALALLLLVTAGQPVATDDTWLHLALGRAYAIEGPWLDADPLLARAPGPPLPTAWLFGVTLDGVENTAGFPGLRTLHVLCVTAVLAAAWCLLRRAGGSVLLASLGTSVFAVLAAYRLVQLRPHLLSMLFALLLYRLLLERERPSVAAAATAVGAMAVWANVHAAFLLGPLLVASAVGALLIVTPLRPEASRRVDLARAVRLGVVGVIGTAATLANPAGARPHLAWFVAGDETPALGRVADEWGSVDPFAWPLPGLPPSPLSWLLFWLLAVATSAAVVVAVRSWRRRAAVGSSGEPDAGSQASARGGTIDPALIGLAVLGLLLPLVAVRFLWLAIFPLLLVVCAASVVSAHAARPVRWLRWSGAASTWLLLAAFVQAGAWPMVSRALPTSWSGYHQPYHAGKYHADLVWVLADAGLRGTAFTDYHMAGFTGYQLAPGVRTLVNGTLNVPPGVIDANLPLRLRRGERPEERFVDLLDRHAIDLFVGIRLPRVATTARPWFHTTGHLERTPGWIPVFRNMTGAVYLRTDERNRANLERVAAWYATEGIPFDPVHGFDPEAVVRADRGWAIQHALVPIHFDRIADAAFGPEPERRRIARELLAAIYAGLGLYERAIALDAPRTEAEPDAVGPRRRLVWCLLRLRRLDEAAEAAALLADRPGTDFLSHRIADTAKRLASIDDPETIAREVATLPVFTPAETAALTADLVRPAPRLPPHEPIAVPGDAEPEEKPAYPGGRGRSAQGSQSRSTSQQPLPSRSTTSRASG